MESGSQPQQSVQQERVCLYYLLGQYSPDRKQILAVNGEIYNHRDVRAKYAGKYDFQTGSDCEVILALYRDKGIHFLEDLNGIFAFALYDEEKDDFLIARDPIGVIPLYIGKDKGISL